MKIEDLHAVLLTAARERLNSAQREVTALEGLAASPFVTPSTQASRPGILVPAYWDPVRGKIWWDLLIATAQRHPTVPIIAIANPASGPGAQAKSSYVDLLKRLTPVDNLRVVGYVSTNYGSRSETDVLVDIERWNDFYPKIGGIFFDEASKKIDHVPLYTRYVDKAHEIGIAILNPGVTTDTDYVSSARADIIVEWEHEGARGAPTGASTITPPRRAALIHHAPTAQFPGWVTTAIGAGFGWFYATDGRWSGEPRFLDAIATALERT